MQHILITGTGRAGTTFLMHFLTLCGFDTGFDKQNVEALIFEKSNAGLEEAYLNRNRPHIIKRTNTTPSILKKEYGLNFSHVFIPWRNIDAVVKSRLRVGNGPGGPIKSENAEKEKAELLAKFKDLRQDLLTGNIKFSILCFNKFMNDFDYLAEKINPVLPLPDNAEEIYNKIRDLNKIHF